MISELDIYRSAKILVDIHGENAPIEAAKKADEMLENGDLAGKAAWLRILKAIQEILLENTRGTIH